MDNELWINAKANVSMALASEQNLKKEERTLDEMLPLELMDYRHVFDKTTAERFPESRPWDHAIDLKDDFIGLPPHCTGTSRIGQIPQRKPRERIYPTI